MLSPLELAVTARLIWPTDVPLTWNVIADSVLGPLL